MAANGSFTRAAQEKLAGSNYYEAWRQHTTSSFPTPATIDNALKGLPSALKDAVRLTLLEYPDASEHEHAWYKLTVDGSLLGRANSSVRLPFDALFGPRSEPNNRIPLRGILSLQNSSNDIPPIPPLPDGSTPTDD